MWKWVLAMPLVGGAPLAMGLHSLQGMTRASDP